jgi:hypothetical protein
MLWGFEVKMDSAYRRVWPAVRASNIQMVICSFTGLGPMNNDTYLNKGVFR